MCVCVCLRVEPHPSGPLKHLSVDDPQLLLLQAVLQVGGPTGVVDEDGEQHDGGLQEEVQRGLEVEEEEREARDQNRGDLAAQHVEHVVPELQDEGHGEAQGRWRGKERGGVSDNSKRAGFSTSQSVLCTAWSK